MKFPILIKRNYDEINKNNQGLGITPKMTKFLKLMEKHKTLKAEIL